MTSSELTSTEAYPAAQQLMQKKAQMEAELLALEQYLSAQKNVGMTQPLVDAEGFPRSDVDVPGVRSARVKVIELRNDLKQTVNDVESALHAVHAELKARREETDRSRQSAESAGEPATTREEVPFASVDAVAPDSPARQAGFAKGDEVMTFGTVNASNHNQLRALTAVVSANEGIPIDVIVRRNGLMVTLTVTPQKWSGRGLLGCHIVPL